MKEIWRDVISYPNCVVSNIGNIKYKNIDKICKPIITGFGYYQVHLYGKVVSVHNLVAEAFIGPRPNKHYRVDHIDNNKLNNRSNNLRYLHHSENVSRSHLIGRQPQFYKGELWLMRRLANYKVNQSFIGKMFKCTQSMVSHVKRDEDRSGR